MKISLPNVSILKMENKYQFIGIRGGLHASLGVYSSIEEGVCKILEKSSLNLLFRTELEHFWRKGVELGWNEEKLFTLGPTKYSP
jgi:hypothetical protein